MELQVNKVLIADPVHENCGTILSKYGFKVTQGIKLTPQQLIQSIKEYDGIIVRSETKVTQQVLEAAQGKLKLIGRAGTGVDNIDITTATKLGVYVLNTPGGNSLSACELTCALISALARNVGGGVVSMKQGLWDRKKLMGTELNGKTLGVIGLGRIGREVAARMRSYGMHVVGFDPLITEQQAAEMGVKLYLNLDQFWPLVDYITVHVPLNQHTKDLVSSKSLSKCKRGVKIINVARGGIVNEPDLLEALQSGQCGGAGLDVYSEEPPKSQHIWDLIKHPLVIPTPHLGASTEEAQVRVAEEIAQQFVALVKPDSGFIVDGAVNSDLLSALSNPRNKSAICLAKALGSLASSIVPLSSKPTLSIHTKSSEEYRWISSCIIEGYINKTGPGCIDEAKNRGLQQITRSHTTIQEETEIILVISSLTTKHTITGGVSGSSIFLLSVDDAKFQPPFALSITPKLQVTSQPTQLLTQLFNESNIKSIGVANGRNGTWLCIN